MAETLETQHAKQVAQIQSQVPAGSSLKPHLVLILIFRTLPFEINGVRENQKVSVRLSVCLQVKYREEVQKERSSSLFSSLPHTLQTERAKELTELQSQVRIRVCPEFKPPSVSWRRGRSNNQLLLKHKVLTVCLGCR